jgi:protein O-mannosyl-transferase
MNTRQFAVIVVSATTLLGFLAYANTFVNDWVWDDVSSVLLHEDVQQPGNVLQLFTKDQHAFSSGQGNFYRPLLSVSFMVDFWLSYSPELDAAGTIEKGYADVQPFIFHLTNTIWHILAAILLFFLLVRLQAPRMIQAAAPLLYVLHPMHTEAVAYISGRADMMSAAFIFGALLCASADSGGRKLLAYGASGVLFILGLCSKESSMIYPVLLALMIFFRPQPDGARPDRQAMKARSLPLVLAVAILVCYGGLRSTVLKFSEGGAETGAALGQRLVETCQAFAFYVKTLFVPSGLHMEQTLVGTPAWTAAIGLLLILSIGALLLWAYRKGQYRIAFGFAWFLAAWLPISGIFPLNAPMAEHWMYVPMAGFWWATLEVLHLISKRRELRLLVPTVASVLAVLFLHGTVARNRDWRDNESVFRATLAENPETLRVHSNLATTYDFLEGNLPGARRHYEALLERYASSTGSQRSMRAEEIPIRLSLGEVLIRQEDYGKALEQFMSLTLLESKEDYKAEAAEALMGLGRCYLAMGQYRAASQAMQRAVKLDPGRSRQAGEFLRGMPVVSS